MDLYPVCLYNIGNGNLFYVSLPYFHINDLRIYKHKLFINKCESFNVQTLPILSLATLFI